MPSLNGLENIISVGGNLTIRSNSALINLAGLEGITFIAGELDISDNDNIVNLTGLEGLTTIGGQLFIYRNESLDSLTALYNLTSIGGELHVWYNNTLATLIGLENIDANTISNLFIRYNDYLSTCDVQSICDYLAAPNGTIDITGNSTGCNSQEEVEAACGVGISRNRHPR